MSLTKFIIPRIKPTGIFYSCARFGIFLGLSFALIANFIVSGFYSQVDKKLRNILGDIIITDDYLSDDKLDPVELKNILTEFGEKDYKAVFISYISSIVSVNSKNTSGMIGSTSAHKHYAINSDELDSETENLIPIAISKSFSKENNITKGDEFYLTYCSEIFTKVKVKVMEIYNNSFWEIDEKLILVSQKWYNKLEKNTGFKTCRLFIEKDINKKKMFQTLSKNLPYFNVSKLKDEYNDIYSWLDILKKAVNDLVKLVIIVSLLNIFIVGIIFILEYLHIFKMLIMIGCKRREIVLLLLKACFKMFLRSILYANYFSVFVFFFLYFFHISINPEIYYISTIPVNFSITNLFMVNAFYLFLIFITIYVASTITFSNKFISDKIR